MDTIARSRSPLYAVKMMVLEIVEVVLQFAAIVQTARATNAHIVLLQVVILAMNLVVLPIVAVCGVRNLGPFQGKSNSTPLLLLNTLIRTPPPSLSLCECVLVMSRCCYRPAFGQDGRNWLRQRFRLCRSVFKT